jgi:hypothetical protein
VLGRGVCVCCGCVCCHETAILWLLHLCWSCSFTLGLASARYAVWYILFCRRSCGFDTAARYSVGRLLLDGVILPMLCASLGGVC